MPPTRCEEAGDGGVGFMFSFSQPGLSRYCPNLSTTIGGRPMGHTLAQFASDCHRILAADPGPEGRNQICALVQKVLEDDAFVAEHLHDRVPDRKILYEDSDLGFCILAHVNHGARESKPHDHGPSWAIYGQAQGETVMSDWEMLEPATAERPGKVRLVRQYTLKP